MGLITEKIIANLQNGQGEQNGVYVDARLTPPQKTTGKPIPKELHDLDNEGITKREVELKKRVAVLTKETGELSAALKVKAAESTAATSALAFARAQEADWIEADACGRSTATKDVSEVRARISSAESAAVDLERTVAVLETRLREKKEDLTACSTEADDLKRARNGNTIREYVHQAAADALAGFHQTVGALQSIAALDKQATALGLPATNPAFVQAIEVTEIIRTAREGGNIELSGLAQEIH